MAPDIAKQVYAAAYIVAVQDQKVPDREKTALEDIRRREGLSEAEARQIEEDVHSGQRTVDVPSDRRARAKMFTAVLRLATADREIGPRERAIALRLGLFLGMHGPRIEEHLKSFLEKAADPPEEVFRADTPPAKGAFASFLGRLVGEAKPVTLGDLFRSKPSASVLLAANLFPALGILLLGWDCFLVIFLYWLENGVIGAYNVLKMVVARGTVSDHASKFFLIPFFCFHYGMFTSVHGTFVIVLFYKGGVAGGGLSALGPGPVDPLSPQFLQSLSWWLWVSLAALIFSHGVSFFVNYVGNKEYTRRTVQEQMMRPYGRIVLIHCFLIAGGVLSFVLPRLAVTIFVVIKTYIDLRMHRKEHTEGPGGEGVSSFLGFTD